MFRPEKLLGALLSGGSRRGGASLLTSQLGMGLLGVAIEAVDHYMKKSSSQAPPAQGAYGGSMPPPAPGASMPPQPPSPGTGQAAAPPPPPGSATSAAPQPAPPDATSPSAGQSEAVLLIRAMIAAANADGAIDQEERQRILDRFQGASLSPEEHTFLVSELLSPATLEDIASHVTSGELARQVYGVSLLAVTVDTDAERSYLQTLGQRLGVSAEERAGIHQALSIENF